MIRMLKSTFTVFALLLGVQPVFVFSQVQPVPYELIENKLQDRFAADPAGYQSCLATITPSNMDITDPQYDDWRIYGDCENVNINPIRVNQSGYRPQDEKFFYYVGNATTFTVNNAETGAELGSGTFIDKGAVPAASISIRGSNSATLITGGDNRYTISGSAPTGSLKEAQLPAGLPEDTRLVVEVQGLRSADFIISDRTYTMVKDALLKFYGVQRSGTDDNWMHPASHTGDDITGGWYDCGDHLKEGITMSYAMGILGVISAAFPDRDTDHYGFNHVNTVNTDGIPDILRELKFGADFFVKAYDMNGGSVNGMITSVGDMNDHNWWGFPPLQDAAPTDRGGQPRPLRSDQASTVYGRLAAGFAALSRGYQPYDATFASKALVMAKAFYDQGKADLSLASSAAYNGESTYEDDMALAAVVLLWATGDDIYLQDLAYDSGIGALANTWFKLGTFAGGWLAHKDVAFMNSKSNTSWADIHSVALWAFYRLILETETKASSFGVNSTERLELLEDIAYGLASKMARQSMSGTTIDLPNLDLTFGDTDGKLGWAEPWFEMQTLQSWIYNRYQAGNMIDIFAYYDVAKDLAGVNLPDGGVQDWKADEVKKALVRMMDYELGVNPWDLSFVYGIGDKNPNHPHHRGANPEGKNVPGAFYPYTSPVGAVNGWAPPSAGGVTEHYDDYKVTEVCLDATTAMMIPVVGLSRDEDLNAAPDVSVQIEYVGYDKAIVTVKLNLYGTARIDFGTTEGSLTQSVASAGSGVEHLFELTGLTSSTTYFFTATGINGRSGNPFVRYLVDSTQTPYSFTTLSAPAGAASIENVKVCNVTYDSAEVLWFTPNGEYGSKVYWDEQLKGPADMSFSQDGGGVPTRFHRMKFGTLTEQTTYYFGVESDGEIESLDDASLPLQFTTPVEHVEFEVRALQYSWGGQPALGLNIINNDVKSYDSLDIRMYLRDKDGFQDNFAARLDICQAYDESGFNKPCEDSNIGNLIKNSYPIRMDDTYDPLTDTYVFYLPIPLGATQVKSGSRVRLDVIYDTRSPWGTSDLMGTPPNHTPGVGDWTWDAHSTAAGNPVDYVGLPNGDKSDSDNNYWNIPNNPYFTVYRKGEFVWGFSPSFEEMKEKKAFYEMDLLLDAPFAVPNGTYVEIDQSSPYIPVTGSVAITEGGYITDIWANGQRINDLAGKVTRNANTGRWDFDFNVQLDVGGNGVDLTFFAGPDPDCAECQQNGGCAFENRNYFIQFSRGEFQPGVVTIQDPTGAPVTSPASPGNTDFIITVRDPDNFGSPSITVLVYNPSRGDTLEVTLLASGDEFKSDVISAVRKDASETSGNEIAFWGGDEIWILYVDPSDEFDVWEGVVFFAEITTPVPVSARAVSDCGSEVLNSLLVSFTGDVEAGTLFDSAWVVVKNMLTAQGDSFWVQGTDMTLLNPLSLKIDLPGILEGTTRPGGRVDLYITPVGESVSTAVETDVVDGVPPKLEVVTFRENPEPVLNADTVWLQFSEPVVPAQDWPMLSTGLPVPGVYQKDADGKIWGYVFATSGNSFFQAGQKLSLRDDASISDFALNSIHDCPSGEYGMKELPIPVPIDYAAVQDLDEDAVPDRLEVRYVRKMRPKDLDSLSYELTWGMEGMTVTLSDWSTEDSVTWFLDLGEKLFPEGYTSGPGVKGAGELQPLKFAFADAEKSLARDEVGSRIMHAEFGEGRVFDSLVVTFSEPMVLDSSFGSIFILRQGGGEVELPVLFFRTVDDDSTVWIFTYKNDIEGHVSSGDKIRLAPVASIFRDRASNLPGENNPWVEVDGSARRIQMEVTMLDELVRPNPDSISQDYIQNNGEDDPSMRIFLVHPESGREKELTGAKGSWFDADSLQVRSVVIEHHGPTFEVELTLKGDWIFYIASNLQIFDNLGQYVNRLGKSFNLDSDSEYLDERKVLRFRIEWVLTDGKAPRAVSKRAVATGAYIGKIDLKVRQIPKGSSEKSENSALVEKPISKSETATIVFGFQR